MRNIAAIAVVSILTFSSAAFAQSGCANGSCGMEPTQVQAQAQSPGQAMQGMSHGAQQGSGGMNMGMMMCPMMKQMAQLQERVRMMEDMMGMGTQKKE